MKKILLLALFTLTFCGSTFAKTASELESNLPNKNSSAVSKDFFTQMKTRLDLTDEQTEQITPILQSAFESRRAIFQKYGIDIENRKPTAQKLGFRKARSLKRELDKVRSNTEKSLKEVLSKEQMREYKAMQNKQKNKMREKFRARR